MSSSNAANTSDERLIQQGAPCLPPFSEEIEDGEADDFEAERDLPSMPKLHFKPLILRGWVLISITVFYLGILLGVGLLCHYANSARIFHISATASKFTIQYLLSSISTLSVILFQSVTTNFARIVPYIAMAKPIWPDDECAPTSQTLLATCFPVVGLLNAMRNADYHLVLMKIFQFVLLSFITPAKSNLIHKSDSAQDPGLWIISISGPSAIYLVVTYTLMCLIMFGLIIYLWDKRTGLKWDPVSLADYMMLLQDSDILADFLGTEYLAYNSIESFTGRKPHFAGMENQK